MIYITAIQPAWAKQEQNIASVRWLEPTKGTSGTNTVAEIVTFIESANSGTAKVAGATGPSQIGVYEVNGRKYLRSYADDDFTNNLLELPRF